MRAAVVAILALAACDTAVRRVELGPLDAAPACEEAKSHSDLGWIQSHIFDNYCSKFTACHQQQTEDNAELSLHDGDSYANLVDQPAKSMITGGKWIRVTTTQPTGAENVANSYLMVLIDPLANPGPGGVDPDGGVPGPVDPNVGSMPETRADLLCKEQRDAIRRWIENGAPPPIDAGIPDAVVDAQ